MNKLKSWLLTTVIGVLITTASCFATRVNAKVDSLEQENANRRVENATIKQAVDDFKADFDEFKRDVKDDIKQHHGNRR